MIITRDFQLQFLCRGNGARSSFASPIVFNSFSETASSAGANRVLCPGLGHPESKVTLLKCSSNRSHFRISHTSPGFWHGIETKFHARLPRMMGDTAPFGLLAFDFARARLSRTNREA
jgi:hypothetical protein